jgi:hypothetical protein
VGLAEVRTIAAAALVLALLPMRAEAHPVDEVVQGAYITLAPGVVRLELDITPGTEVSDSVLRAIDANRDKTISNTEARAYAERVLKLSVLTLDGAPAAWTIENLVVPAYDALRAESDTLKIYAVASRPERSRPRRLAYLNWYEPGKSNCIANIFLQPGDGWRYTVDAQKHSDNGRGLGVNYTARR